MSDTSQSKGHRSGHEPPGEPTTAGAAVILRLICVRRRLLPGPGFICWPATWAERIITAAFNAEAFEHHQIDREISEAEREWLTLVLLAFILGAVLGAFL